MHLVVESSVGDGAVVEKVDLKIFLATKVV